jgi:hypothetical protein
MNSTARTECVDCGEVLYGGDVCHECADHRRRLAELEYDRELRAEDESDDRNYLSEVWGA